MLRGIVKLPSHLFPPHISLVPSSPIPHHTNYCYFNNHHTTEILLKTVMALEVSKAEAAPFTPRKMASDTHQFINDSSGKSLKNPQTHLHSAAAAHFRWTTGRRRLSFRRRKLPTVRLGAGGGKKPRRGFFLVRLLRRVKLRALKQKYICMVKKLRDYYRGLVTDLVEAGGTIESFQQRMLLDSSFAVPVMGLSFNSFPNNNYAFDHRSASTHLPRHHHHHA